VSAPRTAAIVTVGTELVRGLAVDTNTSEIAQALLAAGVDVPEAVSVADDEATLTPPLAPRWPAHRPRVAHPSHRAAHGRFEWMG